MVIQEPIYVLLSPEDIKKIAIEVTKMLRARDYGNLGIEAHPNDFLTAKRAAEYLGFAPSTIRKMTSNKELPYYKPRGGRVLFLKSELDDWIRKERVKSFEEIETEAATYVTLSSMGTKRKG
ncbi:helix-turn-helix domain-containing protein [Cytophagaceae bacterium YF14B1]|uniref:Helix-turn-helix domain-containing protein n=1 Tax=Xanthocytophaga flava TaxID=3048013 RepID=A0AAE3U8Y4_9BACT|nr:helix-turn-helix domain-containing protein [Xanthocytophaga flavus]MDJ1483122.1 helix-turn-helix domain-containing protein [Xanthocytophaga flavus]